jgi:hypothetical protein
VSETSLYAVSPGSAAGSDEAAAAPPGPARVALTLVLMLLGLGAGVVVGAIAGVMTGLIPFVC